MDLPRTLADLQRYIDNKVQENVHLDYKASAAFEQNGNAIKADLGKDVSAFANSDGGVLVIGVLEDNKTGLPTALDGGVPNSTWRRERIEDVISTAIAPQIYGIEIVPIPAAPGTSYYSIAVPKSFRGPHQELDQKRYYKRANFKNRPMEDYEVRDVFARRVSPTLVTVDVDIRKGIILDLVVKNVGDVPAEDLRFKITPAIEKLAKAKLLTEGARFFPPGKTLRFFFGSAIQEIREQEAPKFDIEVSYRNPRLGETIVDVFRFDLSDYAFSAIVNTDIGELTNTLKEALDKLTRELAGVRSAVDRLAPLIGPTGLDLSVSTLRNLRRLARGEEVYVQRLHAARCDWTVFQEVLEVDRRTAELLFQHARWGEGKRLEEVDGLTNEVIERARSAFEFEDEVVPGDE